jgi:hypothetical protein
MFELRQNPWPADAIHVVLDWETMSTAHNAAPVQLAAVTVCGKGTFNEYIDPKSSEAAGLHVDVETVKWWYTQDPELRAQVFGGTKELGAVLSHFFNWLERLCFNYEKDVPDWSRIFLWGNGVEFDVQILREVYEVVAAKEGWDKFPISFRNFDHVRTLYRCVPEEVLAETTTSFNHYHPEGRVHDALWDAKYHAALVRRCLDYLSGLRDAH